MNKTDTNKTDELNDTQITTVAGGMHRHVEAEDIRGKMVTTVTAVPAVDTTRPDGFHPG